MPLSFGNIKISKAYFGNKRLFRIYFGDKLVWGPKHIPLIVDNSNNCVYIEYIPEQDIRVSKILAPMLNVNMGSSELIVYHESGVCCFKANLSQTPNVDKRIIDTYTYNYVTMDLDNSVVEQTFLDSGMVLKAGNKYYIKYIHNFYGQSGDDNNYYYWRGLTGNYTLDELPENENFYDISDLNYVGEKSYESEIVSMDLGNFCKFVGTSDIFTSNRIYKCVNEINYGGETENIDVIIGETDETKIYKYLGQTSTIINNHYYKCVNSELVDVTDYVRTSFEMSDFEPFDMSTLNINTDRKYELELQRSIV